MKKIACIALLSLLFANCKNNDSKEELKETKKPAAVTSEVKKENDKNEDCKDVEVEMGSGRECILKNTDIDETYQNIIKNEEVEEWNYFLSSIPTENKSVEVNQNGLISIDYEITKDKVAIFMNYQGGVTEVTLQKINNTIKKSIYHYAD